MDAPTTDSRQQRGLALAKDIRIQQTAPNEWRVPSATGTGEYIVNAVARTCTCPDHETRAVTCKHIFAVEVVRQRVTGPDGSTTVTDTMRVTYKQDWRSYNAAQVEEKDRVQALLKALCGGIVQPAYKGRGRPPIPLADAVYAATMKIYGGMSGRRTSSDLRECARKGHLAKAPHFNSVFNTLEKPELTPLLQVLVEESAQPLRTVETDFAVDATGFGTVVYRRWYDERYGKERSEQNWLKCHITTGTKTNIVTSVEVSDGFANDSPYLPRLIETTAENGFDVQRVSADKAYSSNPNLKAIHDVNALAYIPFKCNSKGAGPELWQRAWALFTYRKPEFLAYYHRRSNVESTFWMIKSKFGGSVRSRLYDAMVNEILCKVLAHNLCVLVQSFFELKIDSTFWNTAPVPS